MIYRVRKQLVEEGFEAVVNRPGIFGGSNF
jgi:hypothetical protein